MKADSIPLHLCFETLSNPLRIGIIKSLRRRPKTVKELSRELKTEQSTLSHSLAVLRECGFAESSVKGKKREYCLSKSFLAEMPIRAKDLFSVLEAHYSSHCKNCSKEKGK